MTGTTRVGPPGSISGFTEVNISAEGSAAASRPAAPLSVAEMMQRFARLRQDLNPTHLQFILDKIDTHILQDGAVHDLEPADLSDETLTQMVELMFPGTVPDAGPSIAFMAELATFGHDLTLTRNGAIWVTDASGILVEVATDEVAIEHGIDGSPMIPMWPARTNAFIRSGVTAALAHVADTTTSRLRETGEATLSASLGGIEAPDGSGDALICVAGTDSGVHGAVMLSVGVSPSSQVINVTSAFILPLEAEYVTLQMVDTTATANLIDYWAVINLLTGEVVSKGEQIGAVYVAKHPLSGWMRIGLEYRIALGNSGLGLSILGHHDVGGVVYDADGEDLFAIFGLSHTYGSGLAPFIATNGSAVTVGATTLTLNGGSLVSNTTGMILVDWHGYHNTPWSPGVHGGTSLLKIDGVPLMTLTFTGLNVGVGAIKSSGSYENNSPASHALSYDPERIIHKTFGQPKETVGGTVPAFTGDHIFTLGPVPGYLKGLQVYPVADLRNVVNFLVGETN